MDANQPKAQHKVRVTILNQVYNLVTSGDPADIEEVARTVDELMLSISRGGNLDVTRTAVLAAIHLADQLRQAEEALSALREHTTTKSRDLARLLDGLTEE